MTLILGGNPSKSSNFKEFGSQLGDRITPHPTGHPEITMQLRPDRQEKMFKVVNYTTMWVNCQNAVLKGKGFVQKKKSKIFSNLALMSPHTMFLSHSFRKNISDAHSAASLFSVPA